jgi:hypothetical protein
MCNFDKKNQFALTMLLSYGILYKRVFKACQKKLYLMGKYGTKRKYGTANFRGLQTL